MNEESGKREIGSMIKLSDFEVFTWEIRNIASIPHVVDYVVKSPPFYFEGATFIFKLYPYGQTQTKTGYIDLIIDRLHSRIEAHRFDCKIYCKNFSDQEVILHSQIYIFKPENQFMQLCSLMKNVKECPDKWKFAPNDVFTLVCAVQKQRNLIESEKDFQRKSVDSAVGETCIRSRNIGIQEIGEIFNDRLHMKKFLWKICCLRTFEFPEDYQIQSPQFSHAGASWILKIYPYFKLEQLNEPNFDVVLCRLHSEIPEHYVAVEIQLSDADFTLIDKVVTESFIFNSYSTQGNVIHFQLKEEDIPDLQHLHFEFQLNVKKLVKPTVVDDNITKTSMMLQNKVLQDYRELFLSRSDCDVIIKVKGQEFAAHSAILKARSPVLASTFRNDMKEKATGIVDVEDCDPSVFTDFLCFLYCGELENLSVETVFSLFTIADKYDVPDLRMNCINFIKSNLSIDTFCATIALALLHSEAELKDLCIDFFAKNLQEIIVTVKWQSFILENPIQGNELLIKVLVSNKK